MSKMFRFCADVHLGKLARRLRMLGFDTAYKNSFSKEELIALAKNEGRILLSKDSYFRKFPETRFFLIESSDPEKQIREMINYYPLSDLFNPFSR